MAHTKNIPKNEKSLLPLDPYLYEALIAGGVITTTTCRNP